MKTLGMTKNRNGLIRLFVVGTLILFACAFHTTAKAVGGEDLFAQGNRAYAEARYDEALKFYKEVAGKEGYSTSLLYNMANAYYHKRDVGQAILHYRRALYLDPANTDIKANLCLAQKDFGLISEKVPLWHRYFDLLNINLWILIASGAFASLSLLLLLRGIFPRLLPRSLLKVVPMFFLLIFVVSGTGAAVKYGEMNQSVVVRDNAKLLVSPFDSAASFASIKNGRVVRMEKAYGGYLFVEVQGGRSGWIQEKAIEPIVPSGEIG